MPIGAAITAIFSVFLACWFFIMTRDPKEWRLWFMSIAGVPDLVSSRSGRRRHEFALKYLSYFFCTFCITLAVYCIFLTIDGIVEMKRPKTQFEQDQERTKKQMHEMGSNFERLK